MAYFGNFKSSQFNDANPFFQRRRAKKEAHDRHVEEQKKKEQEELKNQIEDITHDPNA
tara:strand:- start:1190 stop:1363 length:174 start_codon:yes stop_codon:yes gene_type:complete